MVLSLDANGDSDASFGNAGWATTPIDDQPRISAIEVDSQGRIVLAGKALGAGDLTPIIARMLADGTLDPDFDDKGLLRIPIVIGEDQAEAMALSSGRPVSAGRALISTSSGAAILRLNSDLIFANDLGDNY